MKNQRGLSDIVSTTLLLLITVAAAALLFSFILPFVQKGLGESSECLPYREIFKFDSSFGYNCYDNSNLHGVSIRTNNLEKNAEAPLGFKLVFKTGQESSVVEVKNGDAVNLGTGGVRMLAVSNGFISVPNSGEAQTYVYAGSKKYDQVEIYPLSSSGKICDKTDTVDLKFCKEVSLV